MKYIPPLLITFIAVFFFGCNKHSDNHHGHEHEEAGLSPLVITMYSGKTELFVEFKPLIVGETSNFAAHFTILGDHFLPLIKGKVTLSLVIGDSGIRTVADSSSSPGIFRLALQPKMAGKGSLVFDIETPDYTDQITIDNIVVFANAAEAMAAEVSADNANDIAYSKEQAWKVEFANVVAQKETFNNIIKTSGQILAIPGDEKMIAAQISGVVSYAGKALIEGQELNVGSSLSTIRSTETVSSNITTAVQQAQQDVATSKAQFERATELAKDQIVTQKE